MSFLYFLKVLKKTILNAVKIKPNQSLEVMRFKNDSGKKHIVCENLTTYKDKTNYDAATPIYYLIVESETGTCIANGCLNVGLTHWLALKKYLLQTF